MAERRYWLVKSEPNTYSFSDLQREDDRTAEWDGVRNYQARNTMRDDMKDGDGVLFYHSNVKPMAVVGTATVVGEGYPDDTAWDPSSEHPDPKSTPDKPIWYMVDIKAESEFARPVTLEEIKQTPGLEKMALVNRSRLSVQPVRPEEWRIIVDLGSAPE
ncbi:MAG: EVE domain-containing protein [Chloroflexi bacterium]|nr:EVE domain-containing protein [Chloroflexota bacterium]